MLRFFSHNAFSCLTEYILFLYILLIYKACPSLGALLHVTHKSEAMIGKEEKEKKKSY